MQWRERSIPGRQNDEVSGLWSDGRPRPSTTLQNRERPSGRTTIGKRSRAATPEISAPRQCGKQCREEADSLSRDDTRRARTPVAPKTKRAAESRPQKPLKKVPNP